MYIKDVSSISRFFLKKSTYSYETWRVQCGPKFSSHVCSTYKKEKIHRCQRNQKNRVRAIFVTVVAFELVSKDKSYVCTYETDKQIFSRWLIHKVEGKAVVSQENRKYYLLLEKARTTLEKVN